MNFNVKNIHEWPLSLRAGVAGVMFILTLTLGYYFDLSRLRHQLNAVIHHEADLKLQYEALMKKKTELKHDISQLPALRAQLAELKKTIIKQDELAEMLNAILKVGGSNHLFFSLFDPDTVVKDAEYEKLPIKVMVVGSYHQLADFISQLANLPQLIWVGDMIISTENKNDALGAKLAQQANAQNLLTMEVNLAVYYQPEEVPDDK